MHYQRANQGVLRRNLWVTASHLRAQTLSFICCQEFKKKVFLINSYRRRIHAHFRIPGLLDDGCRLPAHVRQVLRKTAAFCVYSPLPSAERAIRVQCGIVGPIFAFRVKVEQITASLWLASRP
jgi:hypothetical protein